jgi:hypothetical protein
MALGQRYQTLAISLTLTIQQAVVLSLLARHPSIISPNMTHHSERPRRTILESLMARQRAYETARIHTQNIMTTLLRGNPRAIGDLLRYAHIS